MRPEGVRLDDAAPVGIQRGGPLVAGTYAIAPVILVGETASGPAHVRHLERFQCRHDVIADATCVRNRRIRPDPDSLVDTAPEVFGELAKDVAVDRGARTGGIDRDFC